MQDGSIKPYSSEDLTSKPSLLPSGVRPSNFIIIHRANAEIAGTFIIDREMILPVRTSGYNLNLYSGSASIRAQVFVLPTSSSETQEEGKRPTKIVLHGGTMLIDLREASPDEQRHPLDLMLNTGSRSSIALPRSFKGGVKLAYRGDIINFSPAIKAVFTLFVEAGGVTEGFIGDFDYLQWKGFDEWQGDKVLAINGQAGGTLSICYNDEGQMN